MIDSLTSSGKTHLTMKIKFISSKDDGESQPIHSKSKNMEIMIDNGT